MATDWYNPQTISQYAEPGGENIHIRWDDSNNFAGLRSANGTAVGTVSSLIHIARSPKPNITSATYYIKMTGFNFQNLPDLVSGIELKLSSQRVGRITDDTVILTYNNETIGENQARLEINPIMYYGGEASLWGIRSVSRALVQDSSFGVILRFRSHPSWPHRDPMDLKSVQLRIH